MSRFSISHIAATFGADAETKTISNGSTFTALSVATQSSWKNSEGAWESRTEWHRCVSFGKLADFAATLKKGAHVQVEGELRGREAESGNPSVQRRQSVTMNRTFRLSTVLFGICAGLFAAAAEPDVVIHEDGPNAESMTSTADGALIFGSMSKAEIFRAAKGAASAEVWIKPGTNGLQRILGVFADERSGTLWVCSSGTPTALKTFDLASGAPKGSYDFGLQPHRTDTFKLSPDPLLVEKVRDIAGLYMLAAHSRLTPDLIHEPLGQETRQS